MAGDAARDFHARHEAKRRRARADGGDLGDSGTLAQFVRRWRTFNRRWKRRIDESEAPDRNEEYLALPDVARHLADADVRERATRRGAEYIARIQHYMAKALKEAKLNTSWIQPNEQWDAAMAEFVARILDPRRAIVSRSFLPVAEEIARLGAINSLSQTLLKLTAPGVPDIYQGNEIWDFSLVDPDNRRPVDYVRRKKMLDGLSEATPENCSTTGPTAGSSCS